MRYDSLALGRLVLKLGVLLALQPQNLELAAADDPLLDVLGSSVAASVCTS